MPRLNWTGLDWNDSRSCVWSFPVVALVSADAARDMLSTTTPKGELYQRLLPWLGQGLLISSGEKWHKVSSYLCPCISFDWEYQSSCTNIHTQIKLNRVLVYNQASSIVDAIVPLQCPQGIRFGICQACQDHVEPMASTWRQTDRSTTMHPQSHSRTSAIDPTFTIPIDRALTHSLIHSWIHWVGCDWRVCIWLQHQLSTISKWILQGHLWLFGARDCSCLQSAVDAKWLPLSPVRCRCRQLIVLLALKPPNNMMMHTWVHTDIETLCAK